MLLSQQTRHLTPIIESRMPAMLGHLFDGNSIKNITGAGNSIAIDDNSSVEESDKDENKNDSKKETKNDNNDNHSNTDNNNVNNNVNNSSYDSNNNNSCETSTKNDIDRNNNDSSSSSSSSSTNNNTNTSRCTSSTEDDDYSGFHFLGALLSDDVACAVADGTMDPITLVTTPPSLHLILL